MTIKSSNIPDDVYKKTVLVPCDIAANDFAHIFFSGTPVQLEYNVADYISTVMTQTIKNFSGIIDNENKPKYDLEIANDHLLPAFVYFFDKSLEIVYNVRSDNGKGIKFKIEDLYSGWGGNEIPEYLQIKVTKVIPYVSEVYKKTVKHLVDNEYFDRYQFVDVTALILYGAVILGSEYCKRIDLNDDSEYIKFLES